MPFGEESLAYLHAYPAVTTYEFGPLPSGVVYDSQNHRFTGTPTQAGNFQIPITARNPVRSIKGTLAFRIEQARIIYQVTAENVAYDGSPKAATFHNPRPDVAFIAGYHINGQITQIPPSNSGTYLATIHANDPNYYGEASALYTITPSLPQTITFPHPGDYAFDGKPLRFAATSTSGGPIWYTLISGPAYTAFGGSIFATGYGPITVQAHQSGFGNYVAATPIRQTVLITAPSAFIALLIAADVPPAQRGATDDPDNDGIPNLLEYALGLSPMRADRDGTPHFTLADGKLSLTYQRMRADVTYVVQASTDLGDPASWSEAGVDQGTPDSMGNVTATVPISSPSRFLRLNATLSP